MGGVSGGGVTRAEWGSGKVEHGNERRAKE